MNWCIFVYRYFAIKIQSKNEKCNNNYFSISLSMRNKIRFIFSTCIETCFCNIASLIIIIPKLYLTSRLIPNKLSKTSHNIKNNSSAHLLIFQCTIVYHVPATSLLNENNKAKIMHFVCVATNHKNTFQ